MGKGTSKHAEETGENPGAFDPELIESLPENLKDTFKKAYSNFRDQYDELESRFDCYRVDSGESKNRAEKSTQVNKKIFYDIVCVNMARMRITCTFKHKYGSHKWGY